MHPIKAGITHTKSQASPRWTPYVLCLPIMYGLPWFNQGKSGVSQREREREGEPRERLMTVIKCDVSKNGYQKFGAEFTLVIPPPPPPFLASIFFSRRNRVEISFAPEIWISSIWIFPRIFNSSESPRFHFHGEDEDEGWEDSFGSLDFSRRVNRHRFELYLTRDYLTSFHGCHGLSNRRCPTLSPS